MDRAYSIIDVKAVSEDKRTIEGMASTPVVDRVGDIVEPMGAQFKLPMPLLWQHRADEPVGWVEFAKPNKNGIPFKARIADIEEPGPLKDMVDRAWQAVKAKLVRGVSIGFRIVEHSIMENGGWRISDWEWLELSLVSIPANADATIQTVKSIDAELLAASGQQQNGVRTEPAGVAARTTRPVKANGARRMKRTIAEQIADFEATRQAKAARMDEIMAKAAEDGQTLDKEQSSEYDELEEEVGQIDAHLKRLANLEKAKATTAKPVTEKAADREIDTDDRNGSAVRLEVKTRLPKGTLFTRYVMAMAAGKGSISDALQHAKRWDSQTPEVSAYIKAVAGTSGGGTGESASGEWGGELVYPTNLASEFVELLRAAEIISRISGIRRVPFNVRIPTQTGGTTVNWVGEGAAKPVTETAFGTVTLPYDKIAGIVVLTEELVRLSTPSAEEAVRRDLVEQIVRFMDEQFLDTSITVSDNRPASVTNGVAAVTSSGTDADSLYYDINTALAAFDTAEMPDSSVHLVMRRNLARGISALRNALGQFEFPSMMPGGGTLLGYPVIVSNSAPASTIALIAASEILMADDGRVTIDASKEATLDLDGGDTPNFSLYQKNCIAIRAERWVTWKKRRAEAVALIDTASYGPQGSV
jgi:HK97 family phage major capsid protein/HK97 family phage prohead protease